MGPHVTDLLSAFMDHELGEPERAAVEVHLRGCPSCARHLAELQAVDAVARELPLAVPDGYFEAFRGRLRQRLQPPRPARRRFAPAWTLAAAAAVVLAVLTPRLVHEPSAHVPAPAPTPAAPARDEAVAPPPAVGPTPEVLEKAAPPVAASRIRAPRAEAPGPEAPKLDQPPATAPPAQTANAQKPDATAALGYVAPPAEADRLESAPQSRMETREAGARGEEEKERKDKATRGLAAAERRAAPSGGSVSSDSRFELLLRRTVSSAAQARALRDAWRAFARDDPAGPHADEARVRAIEAGAEAWRRGKDERDRAAALSEGRAYLERPDALQADRVRDLLRSLS